MGLTGREVESEANWGRQQREHFVGYGEGGGVKMEAKRE